MQGTAEAVDAKNKFLQDANGPTSYHFSNGPSLDRILVFQDHVGGERDSYVFNSSISVSFWGRSIRPATSRPPEFQGTE